MTAAPGRLSAALADRYRLERELGQGGMATVYLAQDLRHDRKVAVKVLKPELAAVLGAERFVVEIKTTAALQHPHILPLFDSGTADGFLYYVMPFIDGETLRRRLDRESQLGVEESVRIATSVADALDYAHRHGVVHRDIKPENILLHDGRPMVADFGIALALSAAAGGRMTETGMSLGTPHYMSPEQATADKEITGRSDIYSLASVLYEMLAGQPPHLGGSAQQIIMKIIAEPAPLVTLLRKSVPTHVAAAVARALEKVPADRFETARAFADALNNPATVYPTMAARLGAVPGGSGRRDWRSRVAVPALVALVAMTALSAWALRRPPAAPGVIRYRLGIPAAAAPLYPGRITVSPDGAYLLWSGPSAGSSFVPQLWLKPRDDDRAIPLPGTVGALGSTFSPDGQWIAYAVVGAALRKLQIRGGAAITVADSVAATDPPAWLDDGTIVFIEASGRGLMRVSASGGKATVVWPPDSGLIREVSAVAGREAVLFSRCPPTDLCLSRTAWALDLRTGVGHPLMAGTVSARYLPTGHLLIVRPDGIAIAVPFDARTLEVRGAPVVVLDSVAVSQGYGASLAVSRTGTLAMLRDAAGREVRHEFNWVDRAGRVTPVDMGGPVRLTGSGNAGWALSPDGRSLAIDLSNDETDAIWVKQLPTGPLLRVTLDSVPAFRPRWMPGGHELSFLSVFGARGRALYRVSADGTGRSELLASNEHGLFEGAVSPDGKWIVARTSGGIGKAGRDIIAYRVGDTVAVPLIASPAFDESAFAISPDGRWIAYQSDESGRQEVYVRPFPLADRGRGQASTNGGAAPVWARNGRELFFVDARRQMTAVTVTGGMAPTFGERHALFTLSPDDYLDENTYYTPFDVAPDGRFIIARRIRSDGDSAPLIVAENWFSEMRQALERAR